MWTHLSTTEKARLLRRSATPAEHRLWQVLRAPPFKPWHFRRQAPVGTYFADFLSHRARLIVEVDGDTHASGDNARDRFTRGLGFQTVRVSNREVFQSLDGVALAILGRLQAIEASKAPP